MDDPLVADQPAPAPATVNADGPAAAPTPAKEPREPYPTTLLIVLTWTLLYLAMALHQGALHADSRNWISGGIRPTTAYQFGSLTSEDVFRGQIWRVVTATFLHFSLVHLVVNALVMFQLGREIEPWYGPWNFLAILIAIGGISNLLASCLRPLLHQSVTGQSGGGSGIICGLIGMIAVIGWRERSRFGNYILGQMAVQLIFIGLMGIVLPNVDNLVHACGAAVGALVAFFDRPLQKSRDNPTARVRGTAAFLVVAVSAVAQYLGNQFDHRAQTESRARAELVARELLTLPVIQTAYLNLANFDVNTQWHAPLAAIHERDQLRKVLLAATRSLVTLDQQTHSVQSIPDAKTWLQMAQQPLHQRPQPGTIRRFLDLHTNITNALRAQELTNLREAAHWDTRLGPPRERPTRANPFGREPEIRNQPATRLSPSRAASRQPSDAALVRHDFSLPDFLLDLAGALASNSLCVAII